MEIIARGEYSVKRLPVNGKDAYSFTLSKESATVSYNADGNAISGELGLTGKARTEVCVLRGNTPLTLADPNRVPTNLLLKSNVPATGSGYPFSYYLWGTELKAGTRYTMVVNGRYNGTDPKGQCAAYIDGGYNFGIGIKSSENTTIKRTFVYNTSFPNGVIPSIAKRSNIYNYPSGIGGTSTINWAAMYEGDTAPDEWEPHPSDPVARKGEFKILSATVISGTASISILNNVIYTNSLTSDTAVVRININAEGVDMYRDFSLQKLSIKAQVDATKTAFSSEFQRLNDRISLSVSETKTYADNAVAEIQVGGRNWLLNSQSMSGWSSSATGVVMNNNLDVYLGGEVLKATFEVASSPSISPQIYKYFSRILGECVISFYAKSDSNKVLLIRTSTTVNKINITTNWERYSFIAPTNDVNDRVVCGLETIGVLYLSYMKIESGNRATDWSPAPEDVEADAQAKADNAKEDALAKAAVNHPTKTEFKSSIDQLAGQIRSKVSQTDYNALGERVKKAETEILQTPEAINLAVRKIEVGGNNLIINSDNIHNIPQKAVENNAFTFNQPDADGSSKATLVTFVKDGLFRIGLASKDSILKLKENTTYTYSIWVKPKVGNQIKLGISAMTGDVINLTSGWSRVKFTTSFNEANKWTIEQGWFFVDIRGINAGDSFYFYHPQLEEGNVATAWQISESEKVNKDNIISKINLSEEGILLDGKKVEITGELLAQIIKAYSLNVNDRTIIDALGNFKTVNGTFSGKMDATSGSIGNFSIVNGDIIGVDTAKKERIRISTNPLPTLADLFTGYNIISPELNLEFEDYFEIDSQGSERTQVVCSFRRTIHLEARTTIMLVGQGATYSYRLQGGGTDCFRGATRNEDINFYNSSNQLVATGDWNRPIDIPAGDIIIEITSRFVALSVDAWVDPSIYRLTISTGWQGILAQGTTERTYIGSDGFYSVFGSGEYVYFKRGVGFVTKGKTDTGGVLASGSVAANGTQTNVWGAKSSDRGATKVSVGVFDVPHRVGHTNYTITATSHHGGISMSIVSKSAYTVQLASAANGSEYGVGFDYTIIGQN